MLFRITRVKYLSILEITKRYNIEKLIHYTYWEKERSDTKQYIDHNLGPNNVKW